MNKKMIIRGLLILAVFFALWPVDMQAMSRKEEKMTENVPMDVTGPQVIVLKSTDGKTVDFEKNLWEKSGTLHDLSNDFAEGDFEKPIGGLPFTEKQLHLARSLMAFEAQHALTDDLDKLAEAIKKDLDLDAKNGAKYSEVFDLASFFQLPNVREAIMDHLIKALNNEDDENINSIAKRYGYNAHLIAAIRSNWAKKLYLTTEKITENFEGVSIQDLMDHNQIPAIADARLDLSGQYINSLKGLENIPGIHEVQDLELSCNNINSLEGVQFPDALQALWLFDNQIASLEGVLFPQALEILFLDDNQINSLEGVQFPPTLQGLYLDNNQIASLEGVLFPPTLEDLFLLNNPILQDQIDRLEKARPNTRIHF